MIGSGGVDLLFLNDHEALQLTGERDLGKRSIPLSAKVGTLVMTRGATGALGMEGGATCRDSRSAVSRTIVDTTGAGDLFAAGFLAAPLPGT